MCVCVCVCVHFLSATQQMLVANNINSKRPSILKMDILSEPDFLKPAGDVIIINYMFSLITNFHISTYGK